MIILLFAWDLCIDHISNIQRTQKYIAGIEWEGTTFIRPAQNLSRPCSKTGNSVSGRPLRRPQPQEDFDMSWAGIWKQYCDNFDILTNSWVFNCAVEIVLCPKLGMNFWCDEFQNAVKWYLISDILSTSYCKDEDILLLFMPQGGQKCNIGLNLKYIEH